MCILEKYFWQSVKSGFDGVNTEQRAVWMVLKQASVRYDITLNQEKTDRFSRYPGGSIAHACCIVS